jgi:hypothetical protein
MIGMAATRIIIIIITTIRGSIESLFRDERRVTVSGVWFDGNATSL